MFPRDKNGELTINDTPAGAAWKRPPWRKPDPAAQVRAAAVARVAAAGGDVSDEKSVLGQHTFQFGRYDGKTFHWVMENALGFVEYIYNGMERDRPSTDDRSLNKFAFKKYVEYFPEVLEFVREVRRKKKTPAPTTQPARPGSAHTTQLSKLVASSTNLSPELLKRHVKRIYSPQKGM